MGGNRRDHVLWLGHSTLCSDFGTKRLFPALVSTLCGPDYGKMCNSMFERAKGVKRLLISLPAANTMHVGVF